jgi:hypothetical protein
MGGNYERAWKWPPVGAEGDHHIRHRRTAVYTAFLVLQVGSLNNREIFERRKFRKNTVRIILLEPMILGLGGRHFEQPVRNSAAPIRAEYA